MRLFINTEKHPRWYRPRQFQPHSPLMAYLQKKRPHLQFGHPDKRPSVLEIAESFITVISEEFSIRLNKNICIMGPPSLQAALQVTAFHYSDIIFLILKQLQEPNEKKFEGKTLSERDRYMIDTDTVHPDFRFVQECDPTDKERVLGKLAALADQVQIKAVFKVRPAFRHLLSTAEDFECDLKTSFTFLEVARHTIGYIRKNFVTLVDHRNPNMFLCGHDLFGQVFKVHLFHVSQISHLVMTQLIPMHLNFAPLFPDEVPEDYKKHYVDFGFDLFEGYARGQLHPFPRLNPDAPPLPLHGIPLDETVATRSSSTQVDTEEEAQLSPSILESSGEGGEEMEPMSDVDHKRAQKYETTDSSDTSVKDIQVVTSCEKSKKCRAKKCERSVIGAFYCPPCWKQMQLSRPARKRKPFFNLDQPEEDSKMMCLICCQETITTGFVHSRVTHFGACHSCARKCIRQARVKKEKPRCPFCKQVVRNISKIIIP